VQQFADPIAEANRIIERAKEKRVVLRLFGGVAFKLRCPSANHRSLQRRYVDIDFMGHQRQSREIQKLFVELGYSERDIFNAMQGDRRLIFNDTGNGRRVDVFLDEFEMCHKLSLKDRMEIDDKTIPLADLLATKLQIIEINGKDLNDMMSILVDYEIADTDKGTINGSYLAKLIGNDWGLYKTFTMNLNRLFEETEKLDIDAQQKEKAKSRIENLRRTFEDTPKSLGWKIRAKVGERVRWYELPEADKEIIGSTATTSGQRQEPGS
jgi:hypothetical protein